MAYPLILLLLIAILAGFLLAGRGDLTGKQRRGLLIGLGVAGVAMLALLVFLMADDDGAGEASTTEARLRAALEDRNPAEMAPLTRFAESVLDEPVDAARGFLFDSDRRLVMCIEAQADGDATGVYLRRNSIEDDFDRDTRTESALRDELARFCADAF